MKLIEIRPPRFDVEVDIVYATANNFTGKPIYKTPGSFLHPEAAEKLQVAITLAAQQNLRFKIFDTFRPKEAQQALWDQYPDPHFISNPETGLCTHVRGIAVDLNLIDKKGNELDMGTGFDAFTPRSHHGNTEISKEAQHNRYLLLGIMTSAGWDLFRNEWWHYQLHNPRSYPLVTDKEAGTNMV